MISLNSWAKPTLVAGVVLLTLVGCGPENPKAAHSDVVRAPSDRSLAPSSTASGTTQAPDPTTPPASTSQLPPPVPARSPEVTETAASELPIPLAALGVSPAINLTAEQAQVMIGLADEFLAETKDRAPTSPNLQTSAEDSKEDWRYAQETNDDRFRLFLGDDAFRAQDNYRAQVEYDQTLADKRKGSAKAQ